MKKIKIDWQWLLFILSIGLLILIPPNYNFFKTHFNFDGNVFVVAVTVACITSLICAFFFCLWLNKQKNIISTFTALSITILLFPILFFIIPKEANNSHSIIVSILITSVLFPGSFIFFRIAYLIKTIGHQNKKKFFKPCVAIGFVYLLIGLYFLLSIIF